jgi:hypothetical protein
VNAQRRLWSSSLLAGLLAGAGAARAQTPAASTAPAELATSLPAARLQGRARMRFMGLSIYEARLWVGAAPLTADWAAAPFAIEIEYARTLWGSLIAERSLTEMRRQGEIAPDVAERWLATMKTLFPDVKEGDRLTGVHTPGQGARFFLNGAAHGTPQDTAFSRVFFGIWLSPQTSEPALRNALLGQAN